MEVGGFVLTETLHEPGVVLPQHDHASANINLTLKGSFEETVCGRTYDSGPMSVLMKPPGEHHRNRYGQSGAHCLIIEVLAEKLEALGSTAELFGGPRYVNGGALSAIALRIHQELRRADVSSPLMVEGLVLEILATAYRQPVTTGRSVVPPKSLHRAKDFVHANFTDQISLSSVAEAAGVNATYLAQLFRRFYRCSVGEYVRRLKIEHSMRQLLGTTRPISDIALSAGFYDQSHFTRAFKDYSKLTPAEFRRAGRST